MLGVLRRNKNSPIITILLGLVALLMIGFGVSFGTGGGWPPAAKVDGEPIPGRYFQLQYASVFRNMQSQDSGYDRERSERDKLRERVLDQLVTQLKLKLLANKAGLRVDDELLRNAILKNPMFLNEQGQFSRDHYERVLSYIGYTDQQFERLSREEMLAGVFSTLPSQLIVSEDQMKRAFIEAETKTVLSYLLIPPALLEEAPGEAPDDAKLTADFKAAHKDADDLVKTYYRDHKSTKFDVPKRVCIQQIFVRSATEDPIDLRQANTKKLEAAQLALKAGKSFESQVKAVSEDNDKKPDGMLGCFTREDMPAGLGDTAFEMKKGEISPIVKSPFGLHILRAADVQEPIRKKLDEVQDTILLTLAKEAHAAEVTEKKANALAAEAKSLGGLDKLIDAKKDAHKDAKLSLAETAPFARSSRFFPELGVNPDLAKIGFQLSKDAPVAGEAVKTDRGWILVSFKERQAADMANYDTAKTMLYYQAMALQQENVAAWSRMLTDGDVTHIDPVAVGYGDDAERIREQRWAQAGGHY